jgi:general stress protein 26
MAEPRSRAERRADALQRLGSDVDCWVASASGNGETFLTPLSHYWDGARLTLATARASRTAQNLIRAGRARVALGPTRDVVIVEGSVEAIPTDADIELAEAHSRAAGFDARAPSTEYVYLRITPETIQAWREENELGDRTIMRDGVWLD